MQEAVDFAFDGLAFSSIIDVSKAVSVVGAFATMGGLRALSWFWAVNSGKVRSLREICTKFEVKRGNFFLEL